MNPGGSAWAAIAACGALGAVARFALGAWVQAVTGSRFPAGTLLINLVGSAALGLVFGLGDRLPTTVRLGLGVGFLGAFTTFSTFSVDNMRLLQDGEVRAALVNLGVSVGGGLGMAALGLWAGNALRG